MKHWLFGTLMVAACATDPTLNSEESEIRGQLPNNLPLLDQLGFSSTFSIDGHIDLNNEFFQEFGTNGRTCGSCHTPTDGWTVSVDSVRLRFFLSRGLDPIFRTNDGTNSPNADVSTLRARRAAYSMLLDRGTIRVGIGVPSNAEFELVAVDDPYNFASAAELSLFRRPLPAANLALIKTVMWDGRVTGATIPDALSAQADGATLGHAQAIGPLPHEANQNTVDFESGLFNAQIATWSQGRTDAQGATGGPEPLASQSLIADRFDLFDAWQNSDIEARRSVYRGQEIFNTHPRSNGGGPCRGCHSTQNSGTNANGAFFVIGVSAATRRTADLPLYTLRNKTTSVEVQTTDPGRALITGLWNDVGRFKAPSIRGLGARPPYFHDGSARTLLDVVRAYQTTLAVNFTFTPDEEKDLVAFLSAL